MPTHGSRDRLHEDIEQKLNLPLMRNDSLDDDGATTTNMANCHDKEFEQCLYQRSSRTNVFSQRFTERLPVVLNAVLTVVCLFLIAINFVLQRRNYDIFSHVPPHNGEIIYTPGVAPPLLGPEFQKRTIVFQRNESFMYEKSKAYPAWHEILHVARHGRVAFESRPGEFFGVGGYHELHCVWLLQQAVDLAANGPRLTDDLQIDHMYHCAEFLRQSVMCHADNTIERRFEGILGPFSANNTHVCGNWNALMEWSNDHIYTGPYLNPHTRLPP